MLNLNHKKLDVWKNGMDLVKCVYEITGNFPRTEQWGLTSQMRRAAVSICSNPSEGASRTTSRERRRFFEIARSSLVEMDTQFEIAYKLSFIGEESLGDISKLTNSVFAQLSRLLIRT